MSRVILTYSMLIVVISMLLIPTIASPAPGNDNPIVVVVNQTNPVKALSTQELQNIFLRKQQVWSDGISITVFERSGESEIRQKFAISVLKQNLVQLQSYWLKLKMTRGLKGPKVCRSSLLVTRYLERVKGGIGYMYKDEVDSSLKIVAYVEHH